MTTVPHLNEDLDAYFHNAMYATGLLCFVGSVLTGKRIFDDFKDPMKDNPTFFDLFELFLRIFTLVYVVYVVVSRNRLLAEESMPHEFDLAVHAFADMGHFSS